MPVEALRVEAAAISTCNSDSGMEKRTAKNLVMAAEARSRSGTADAPQTARDVLATVWRRLCKEQPQHKHSKEQNYKPRWLRRNRCWQEGPKNPGSSNKCVLRVGSSSVTPPSLHRGA